MTTCFNRLKKNIVQSLLLETKQLHVLSSFPPCHVKAVVTLIGLQLRQMTRLSVSSLLMWWNPRCIRLLSPHCVIPAGAQLQKSSGYSTLASTAGWFLMSRFQSRRENSARTKFATERKAFGNIQKLLLSQTLHSNIHCFIVCDLGVPWVEGWTKPDCVEGLKQLMSVGPLKKR